jgi:hypothetical protein
VAEVRRHLSDTQSALQLVVFAVFGDEAEAAFRAALANS